MTDSSTEEWWQDQLNWRNSDPWIWFFQSQTFEQSAKIILERYNSAKAIFQSSLEDFTKHEKIGLNAHDISLVEIFFYLIGTSIELALKGTYIQKYGEFSHKCEKSGHDLVTLAQLCGFELSADEISILKELHFCLQWTSKYPVPKLNKKTIGIVFMKMVKIRVGEVDIN